MRARLHLLAVGQALGRGGHRTGRHRRLGKLGELGRRRAGGPSGALARMPADFTSGRLTLGIALHLVLGARARLASLLCGVSLPLLGRSPVPQGRGRGRRTEQLAPMGARSQRVAQLCQLFTI